MAGEAQQAQQQVTPEMLKKLQGEEKEKKTNTFNSSGSNHWVIKFGKDMAYISFFHIILLKDVWEWLFTNRSENEPNQVTNIIKNNNNSKDDSIDDDKKIIFQEVDEDNLKNEANENQFQDNPTPQKNWTKSLNYLK